MNTEQAFAKMIKDANQKSASMLIERCEKTQENPYGIRPVEYIAPDELVVVGLPGTVSTKENLHACNGILKNITNFIQNHPKLQGIKVRPVMAVCEFGKYFDEDTAKHLMLLEQNDPKKAAELLQSLPLATQQELMMPGYVKDIYNAVLEARLSANNGTVRLPQAQALRNIRKTIFVPYCWGGYTVLKLETLMQKEMSQLNYDQASIDHITSQMLSVAFSPSCPIGINKSRMVSFSSASDINTKHNNYAKEYLNMQPCSCPDFGYLWWDSKEGNIFYCAQFNKNGVEGNPRQSIAIKIDSWEDLMKPLPEEEKKNSLSEHDFIGFTPHNMMSNAAKKIQYFAQNVLVNGIRHAAKLPQTGYKDLPNTRRLAANTPKDHWDLFQAYRLGLALKINIQKYGKEKILKDSYAANVQFVKFD